MLTSILPPSSFILVIVGPTASGKSALAVEVCRVLDGEIVNCDSRQVYRHMNVGTAKPTAEQRARVPHHLYDVVEPDEPFSAGRYAAEARRLCREVAARGRVPVVVGGTGLYLRALLEGIFPGPGRCEEIRRRLRRIEEVKGRPYLHSLLARKDPAAAARITPRDGIRIVRALEVYFLTGTPISRLQPLREPLEGFSIFKVGLDVPRQQLYDRINRRAEEMFAGGLLQEVRELLRRGYSPDVKGFEALGYRVAVACLRGELNLQEAIDQTSQATRRYAKRQMTWFRREKEIHWISAEKGTESALQDLLRVVRAAAR